MAIELPNDFKEFLSLLRVHGVKYLLIGGYAVGYYGYPRATNDLDIWIAATSENAARLLVSLTEFGFNTPEISVDLLLDERRMLRMGFEPVRIEIMKSISGVSFDECYTDRVDETIDGVDVSIISLKHLKINKQASGRLKDLADIEHLP